MPKSDCLKTEYQRLKAQDPDMTQLRMAEESGLSLPTIQRIARGMRVGKKTEWIFRSYVAPFDDPPGWPRLLAAIRRQYKWADEQKIDVRKNFLDMLEPALELIAAQHREPSAEAVCTLWLLAWIAHDRSDLFQHANVEQNRQVAIGRYDRAGAFAQELSKQNPQSLIYKHMGLKLNVTSWVLYYNAQPIATRSRDPKVIEATKDRDIVGAVKTVAESEPHDWSLIRNGLQAASIENLADECKTFYAKLVVADSRFANWDYSPNNGKLPSLAADPDLWFARSVLELEKDES